MLQDFRHLELLDMFSVQKHKTYFYLYFYLF